MTVQLRSALLVLWFLLLAPANPRALPAAQQDHVSSRVIPSASSIPLADPSDRPRKYHALDRHIDRILAATDAQRGFWGVEVIELAGRKLLYARQAENLFIPASNMKMFTTAAALEKLGPAYQFRTTVESDSLPDASGAVGDLYLVGRGDPDLGARTFPYTYHGPAQPPDRFIEDLADQVKARGVRLVHGALIADDSYFVWEPYAPNWAADDLQWGYGAPVTALAYNDNSLTLQITPGALPGQSATVQITPVRDYYQPRQRVETTAPGSKPRIYVERQPGSMQLEVWGQIPAGSDPITDTVAILNPPRLVGELFRRALEARDIRVTGRVEVRHATRLEAATEPQSYPQSPGRVVLAEHDSPPLREIIKVINKESENLHAEMLLRTLGRVVNHYGSLTSGIEALNAFARQVGILPGETYISDGSGLSREDLVAPHASVKLLLSMAASPNFTAFFESLPISGVDGTLAHRLEQAEVKGRIHAKTGSVEHVNTLAGYMDLPSGKRLVFSIMANNHPLANADGEETLDAIALEIYRWFAKRK